MGRHARPLAVLWGATVPSIGGATPVVSTLGKLAHARVGLNYPLQTLSEP